MTSRTRAPWLVLLFLGLVHTASPFAAQTNRKPSRKQAPKQKVSVPEPPQGNKQQAMELLPLLAERIDTLKSPAWKGHLKGFLAELLATHNPEGARQLFQQSLQALEAAPVRRSQDAEGIDAWELNSVRSELLTRAALADPRYAQELAENLNYTAPAESADAEGLARRKARIVGSVGIELAKDQPELAAQWVETNLAAGVSRFTYLTLEALHQQNPQLADATFNKALAYLESDPGASSRSVMALGSYLFPNMAQALFIGGSAADEEDRQMGFDLTGTRASGRFNTSLSIAVTVKNLPTADPDPELVSRYLNLAYERYVGSLSELSSGPVTADNPALQGMFANLPMAAVLRPLLAKHLPEKAASLQARLNELSKYFSNEDGSTLEKTLDMFASISDLEKQAHTQAETTPENQDSRYYDQAMNAIRQGRTAEAIAIMDKVKKEGMRANIRSALVSSQIREAIEQGQLDNASAQARTLTEPSYQIPFLIQIAEQHTKRKEPEPALLCLTEAEQLLDKLDVRSRLNFALEILEAMARLDAERAYHSAARLVQEINKAGTSKSEPSPQRNGPDLMIATNLLKSESFSLLAEADFNAALALAQSIVRPETSIAAQLAVCRAVLSNTGQSSRKK